MKRIGLMGCGVVAEYGHLPVLRALPGVEVVLFDPNAGRVATMRAQFEIACGFTDEAAFFDAGLDAVSIASPAGCHPANIRAAVARGLPVLCEKPLALDGREAQAAVDAAAVAGVPLFTGFDYRFSPVAQTIHRLIREGAVGELAVMRLCYLWNCHGKYETLPDGRRVVQARREGRMLEGGPMIDCGVHQIDLARWWSGREVAACAGHGGWADDYDAPDHVFGHLQHAGGAHTLVEMSYSYGQAAKEPAPVFTYEIIGPRGVIRYDRGARLFELRGEHGTADLGFAPEKNFAGMYAAFVDFLKGGNDGGLPSGADGVAAIRIATAVTRDAMDKRRNA
ncbi:MAG: Gfo/Idh/MocA family oxidoreductase [Kiritimatiellaeota bacterium]|nr:Gfo/Idh/MocA family oxidoreductase [Kiritimatiellota bacterium]